MVWQRSDVLSEELTTTPIPFNVPLNIAIVDDEKELTDLLVMILNSSGKFRVVATANNGWEALELVRNRKIDAVLIDLYLPGLNGMMVLERLQQTTPGLPVVVMSGFPVIDVFSRGAKGYLEKRGDLTDLPSKLFELLVSS